MQGGLQEVPKEWSTIGPKWRSPIYLSRAQQADAGMKQLTAVPWLADTDVGLELLGLDEQTIARAMSQKRRAEGQLILKALAARGGSQFAKTPAEQSAIASSVAQGQQVSNDVAGPSN